MNVPATFSRFGFGLCLGRLTAAVLLVGMVLPVSSALAQVTSSLKASFVVRDDTTMATSTISFENLFTFDQATGQHTLVAPGTSLAGTGWKWVNETYMIPGTTGTQTARSLRLIDESQATVTLFSATGKIDPFMTYSLSVKNNTATTQTYSFVFGEAISPTITGNYSLFADVAMSISTSTPPATIAPAGLKLQQITLSDNGGLTSFNGGVGVGNTLTRATPGTSTAYDASPLVNSSTGLILNWWEFQTSFTLTPGGDAVGLSGFAEITPIPEPGAYALLAGCGVFGLAALRRGRKARPVAV